MDAVVGEGGVAYEVGQNVPQNLQAGCLAGKSPGIRPGCENHNAWTDPAMSPLFEESTSSSVPPVPELVSITAFVTSCPAKRADFR